MSLFVVQHKHTAEGCPAADTAMAPMLLKVLASASESGVEVLAEAVVDGQHELNLIVSADAQSSVDEFMAPFKMMGTVSVRQASRCEKVVERGAC